MPTEAEMDNQEHANPFERLRPHLEEVEGWLEKMVPVFARGTAILSVAYLERELENLLKAFLVDDIALADELLSGFGPLATFNARIETGFAIGLISEQERRNLQLIRKIRNRFAHMPLEVSFETPEIRDRCMELQPPPPIAGFFTTSNDDPHGKFHNTFTFLLWVLILRRQNIAHRARATSLTIEEIEQSLRGAEGVEE